jgi:WD40 repeat protein
MQSIRVRRATVLCDHSDHGSQLITLIDRTVRVWDVATGEEKAKLEGHGDQVTSVSFSPDGVSIVSGSTDKTVRVWGVSTGQEKAKREGHSGWVLSGSFSPDGLSIVCLWVC